MFDELQRLHDDEDLLALLLHYAELSKDNREVWQDRLMTRDQLSTTDLTRLHGLLLAFEWIEQNTGVTPSSAVGGQCYRITSAGLRAIKQTRTRPQEDAIPDDLAA